MSSYVRARLACTALLLLFARSSHAGPLTVDLPTALARAKERAPDAIAALARIDEARAQRVGADVLFTRNPEVDLGAGRRYSDPETLAVRTLVGQQLEPTRRGARIRVAEAGVAHAEAQTDAELRELAFAVTNAFYEARFADLAAELAERTQDAATRAAEAAQRRRRAGDITDLDLNLARIALGRARAALAAAWSRRAEAIGRLGVLIGAQPDDVITLTGELKPPPLVLDALRARVASRADIRAYESEARVAREEGTLARANGRPDLGVWFAFERDEGDSIVIGGVSFTLPLWNRAQGDKAAALAKLRRAQRARAAALTAASRQLSDAFDAYTRARESVDIFERDVLPTIADSEQLLERSVETAQLSVSDYLAARQETLAGRREYLERLLELAKAAASVQFTAGVRP